MRRFGSSPLFVAMAAVTLVVYATLSVLTYRALLSLWAQQPDPATTAAAVVALTLVTGYASYRLGTAWFRFAFDPAEFRRTVRTADAAVTSLVVVCLFVLTAVVQAYSRRRATTPVVGTKYLQVQGAC